MDKAALTDAWRRERRAKEIAAFRQRARREFVAEGMTRREAGERAWDLTLRTFPPMKGPDSGVKVPDGRTVRQYVAQWFAQWVTATAIEVGEIPAGLPECTSADEDWARANFGDLVTRVIRRDRKHRERGEEWFWELDWSRAAAPPSEAAASAVRDLLTRATEHQFLMRNTTFEWRDVNDDAKRVL